MDEIDAQIEAARAELAAHPQIRLNEIRQRRFYIVDRAQVRAKDSLQRQEDTEVFKVLNAGVPTDQSISVSGTLQPENINLALTLIEEHELIGAKVVLHPQRYKALGNSMAVPVMRWIGQRIEAVDRIK